MSSIQVRTTLSGLRASAVVGGSNASCPDLTQMVAASSADETVEAIEALTDEAKKDEIRDEVGYTLQERIHQSTDPELITALNAESRTDEVVRDATVADTITGIEAKSEADQDLIFEAVCPAPEPAIIRNTENTLLAEVDAGDTYIVPDGILRDTAGNQIGLAPAGAIEIVDDSDIKNSLGTIIATVKAENEVTLADFVVRNSAGEQVDTSPAGTEGFAPSATINRFNGTQTSVKSGGTFNEATLTEVIADDTSTPAAIIAATNADLKTIPFITEATPAQIDAGTDAKTVDGRMDVIREMTGTASAVIASDVATIATQSINCRNFGLNTDNIFRRIRVSSNLDTSSVKFIYPAGSGIEYGFPFTRPAGENFEVQFRALTAAPCTFELESENVRRATTYIIGDFDPSTTAILAAMTTEPSNLYKLALDDFVRYLKDPIQTVPVWDKAIRIWLPGTQYADGADINLKNPSGTRLVAIGGPTFSSGRGWATNGTTHSIATGFNPSTQGGGIYLANDASVLIYVLSYTASGNYFVTAVQGSNNVTMRATGSTALNYNGTNNATLSATMSTGMWSIGLKSNVMKVWKNAGVVVSTRSDVTTGVIPNINMTLQTAACEIPFAVVGPCWTDAEVAYWNTGINNYLDAIGTLI